MLKNLFKKYAFVLLAIIWTEVDYAVIMQYCTSFKKLFIIGGVSLLIQLCLISWGIVFATRCRDNKLNEWPILQKKWIYSITLILFVLYMLCSYAGAIGYSLIQLDVYQLFAVEKHVVFMASYGNICFALCAVTRYLITPCFILWMVAISIAQYNKVKKDCEHQRCENSTLQEEITKLRAKNDHFIASLQSYLKNQIQLTLALREKALILHDNSLLSVPGMITTDTQWDEFLTAYNMCHDDVLNRLRHENPKLTDTDMLYLVLYAMDMSPHDMSLLLDSSDRTIWNRRQLVKEHLNQEISDLDEWIKSVMHT